jgi:hypothetical protein
LALNFLLIKLQDFLTGSEPQLAQPSNKALVLICHSLVRQGSPLAAVFKHRNKVLLDWLGPMARRHKVQAL